MKIKLLIAGGLAGLALFATACSGAYTGSNFKGTTINYGEAEANFTTPRGTSVAPTARYVSIKVGSSSFSSGASTSTLATIAKAAADSTLSVTITSYSFLDQASIEKAFKFYTITQNDKYLQGAPVRASSPLASSIKECEVTGTGNSPDSQNVTTSLIFTIDTSSVTVDTIALLVDATILKDKRGSFVLNGDQNEKTGEETDSLVRYISITKKADGTATDSFPVFYAGENFAPSYPVSAYSVGTPAYSNGKVTLTSYSAEWYDYSKAEDVTEENLASALNESYVLQTLSMTESAWKDNKLSFDYKSASKRYEAVVEGITTGTKYRVMVKHPSKEKAPSEKDSSIIRYGHPSYLTYKHTAYTSTGTEYTVETFSESPSQIITTGTFTAGTAYTSANIITAQRGLLSAAKVADDIWKVTLSSPYEFDKTEGFIVTDIKNTKVESVTTKESETILYVTIKNKVNGEYKLWVGKGTSIKANATNANQLEFGNYYTNVEAGDVSGYVNIEPNITISVASAGSQSSSSNIMDYTLSYVDVESYMNNGYNTQNYYTYLQGGKSYTMEIISGFVNSDILTDAGYTAGTNYYIYLYDPNGSSVYFYGYTETYGYSYHYRDDYTFTAPSSGVYNIRIWPHYTGSSYIPYNGYVGYHIYQN